MKNSLQKVSNSVFGSIACDYYSDGQGEFFMTRQQIGRALGYENPNKDIDKIHSRHKDRLDKFSTTITLGVVEGNREVNREMILYSAKASCRRMVLFLCPEKEVRAMGAQTFNQITKAQPEQPPRKLTVMKSDDERRLVFGWANVAVRVDGEQIVDWQEDIIDTEELENAAYEYVAEFGTAGEMHRRGGVGRVVESVVFTKEKADALGIPPDILPQGWWIGFKITDDEVWQKVKSGEYPMFSIEGKAIREPVEGGDD